MKLLSLPEVCRSIVKGLTDRQSELLQKMRMLSHSDQSAVHLIEAPPAKLNGHDPKSLNKH